MHTPASPIARGLNIALLISFLVTIAVPVTGIAVHKLASTLFLLLSLIHTIVYRKKLQVKRIGLLILIVACFLSGLFGMIFDEIPLILALHKVLSIAGIFFLAIHIFLFHKKLGRSH